MSLTEDSPEIYHQPLFLYQNNFSAIYYEKVSFFPINLVTEVNLQATFSVVILTSLPPHEIILEEKNK